jgi:hypothetical protein
MGASLSAGILAHDGEQAVKLGDRRGRFASRGARLIDFLPMPVGTR